MTRSCGHVVKLILGWTIFKLVQNLFFKKMLVAKDAEMTHNGYDSLPPTLVLIMTLNREVAPNFSPAFEFEAAGEETTPQPDDQ